MPPYTGPSKERSMYSARFIRVEDRLYVSDPDDDSLTHRGLADHDAIFSEIQQLKADKPHEVDAGKIFVYENEITVAGNSWTLGVPVKTVENESRSKTVTLFEASSPSCTIYKSRI